MSSKFLFFMAGWTLFFAGFEFHAVLRDGLGYHALFLAFQSVMAFYFTRRYRESMK